MAAFFGFFFAQAAKVFTNYYTEGRWDLTRLVGSGGMPSSHTALVRHGSARGCARGAARLPLPRQIALPEAAKAAVSAS